jgi:SAM-dependent methyltransferase
MNCLLCGGATHLLFSARDHVAPAQLYNVLWCCGCSFGRLEGTFTPDKIATFYPPDYYTHDNAIEVSTQPAPLMKLVLHIAWRMDRSRPVTPSMFSHRDSILDIGCGNGGLLKLFNGSRRVGIDPDPSARLAAADTGEIYDGTAEDLPLIDRSFDVVVLSHVLEHCIDPERALRNAASKLSRRGTLMIEVPNNDSLSFSRERATWPWTDIPRHLNFFTERSLKQMVKSASLSVISSEYCGFTRQFTEAWLAMRRTIYKQFGDDAPNVTADAIKMLLCSIFLNEKYTHDSIRIFCRL